MYISLKSFLICSLALLWCSLSAHYAEGAYFESNHSYEVVASEGLNINSIAAAYEGGAGVTQGFMGMYMHLGKVTAALEKQGDSASGTVGLGSDPTANAGMQADLVALNNTKVAIAQKMSAYARVRTEGHASSTGSIVSTVSGSMNSGSLKVGAEMTSRGTANNHSGVNDSAQYTVIDTVTGDSVSGALYDASFQSSGVGTSFLWYNGALRVSALRGSSHFSIMLADDPYLSTSGLFSFSTVDGLITDFTATGFFAAFDLLTIGASAIFDLALPTFFDLGFDFSGFTSNEVSTEFLFSSGGNLSESPTTIPEPSTFVLLGGSLLAILLYLRRKGTSR